MNDRAEKYQRVKYRLAFVGMGLDILLLLVLQWSGLSFAYARIAAHYSTSLWIINSIYITFFAVTISLFHLPLSFFSGYVWEHCFGLSTQSLGDWIKDEVKKGILGFILLFIAIHAIYFFLNHFPNIWWIWVGTFWLFLSLFMARILPNIIIPLFYKYSQIENQDLRRRIQTLFEQCRVQLKDVYAINFSTKTKKANAFVCGWGSQKRVVLSDTLIDNFTIPEIEAVVAHELSHYKNKDILKMVVVNTITVFISLFLANQFLTFVLSRAEYLPLRHIANLPLFALTLTIIGLITAPVLNAYSRFIERQADRFSLDLTKNSQGFISMMRKLAEMNLAELQPSRFIEIMFYDHPSIAKRIEFAEGYQKS